MVWEVLVINLAKTIQCKFAVPYFDVFDSELPEFSVPVAVRGSFDFNIEDYRGFIKKHRLDNFSMSDLQTQLRDSTSEYVKDVIANVPDSYSIRVIQIERLIREIKTDILSLLSLKFYDDYGITLKDINIAAIDIDKESEGYKELKTVTKDLTAASLINRNKAQNVAERREIKGNQSIGMIEKILDVKENQFARHKQIEREYSDVIEDNRAGKIGAIGGKLIRDISKLTRSRSKDATPPPIPTSLYNVAVNGQATGPYDVFTLSQMAIKNEITGNSLVWKKGMKDWTKASLVDELKDIFEEMPPIPNEQ